MANGAYDVIVVGAGPAGSTCSFCCAKAGLKTLLLDAQHLPSNKLCAGGVSAWVIKNLKIPDALIERSIERVQVVAGSKVIPTIPWPREMAYSMVMRKEFDDFLVQRAKRANVEIRDETPVYSMVRSADGKGSEVNTSSGVFRARIVIGCDGASSIVAKTSGLWEKWWTHGTARERWREHQAYCLETHVHLDPQAIESRVGNTMILLFERTFPGYFWIFPKRKVLTVGVALFSSPPETRELKQRLDKFIRKHPVASQLLLGDHLEPIRGAYLPIRGPLSPTYDDGVMVAGDSASHVGAVWGEGIYFAIRAGIAAGETAAQAIQNNDVSRQFLKHYEARWRREIGENLEAQARILNEAPTPLQATVAFAEYISSNRSKLYT